MERDRGEPGRPSAPFGWRVFAVALAVRLLPVLALGDAGIGLDDMFQYDMLGRSLASGNGYRWYAAPDLALVRRYVAVDVSAPDYDPARGLATSFRAPLYPAFLAGVYLLSGTGAGRFLAARLAQALLLGAPLAPLTYLVTRRLFPDRERAARRAAWFVALYPMLVLYPAALVTENLFHPLLLASVLALLVAAGRPSAGRFALSGLLLALASLTRSTLLPFVALAGGWVFLVARRDDRRAGRRRVASFALAFALVTVPWALRNSLLHGRLTGLETSLGYNLYLGYHPESTGAFRYGISLDLLTIPDDARRDAEGTSRALRFVADDPARVPYLALRRLGHFFGLERRGVTYFYSNDFLGPLSRPTLLVIAAVLLLPFVALSLSAIPGLLLPRKSDGTALLWLLLAGYLAPHVLILAEDRFHLALVPFLAGPAALFWTAGRRELAERLAPRRRAALAAAACAAALLVLSWTLEIGRDADRIALLLKPGGNRTYLPY